MVTRVPCDWDLFLDEVRAAATPAARVPPHQGEVGDEAGHGRSRGRDLTASSGGGKAGRGRPAVAGRAGGGGGDPGGLKSPEVPPPPRNKTRRAKRGGV